jgi:hypothetical protein
MQSVLIEGDFVRLRFLMSLLGKNSVKTFPWIRSIVRGEAFLQLVSYQRKEGDHFSPQLLSLFIHLCQLCLFIYTFVYGFYLTVYVVQLYMLLCMDGKLF